MMAIRPNGIQSGRSEKHHTCLRKNSYTKRIALRVARRARKQGENVWPYRCPHCAEWHVGHPVGGPRHV